MKKLERDWGDIQHHVLWLISKKLPWLDRIKLPLVCKSWALPSQELIAFAWKTGSPSPVLTVWDSESNDWVKLNAQVPGKVSFSSSGLVCSVRQQQLSVVDLSGEVVKSTPIPKLPPLKRLMKKASKVTRFNSTFVLRDEETGWRFAVMYTTFKEDSWTRWLVLDVYNLFTSKWSRHTHWYEAFVRARTPGVAVKGCVFTFLVEGPDAQQFSLISFNVKTQLWKVESISGQGNFRSFVPNLVVCGGRFVTVVEAPDANLLEVKEIDTSDDENIRWMHVETKGDELTGEVLSRKGRFTVVSDGLQVFVAQTSPKKNGEVIISLDLKSRQWKPVRFQQTCSILQTCFNLSL